MQGSHVSPSLEWLPPESEEEPGRLLINVLYTTPQETRFALKRATELSASLNAQIVLIVAQIVPFPLDLDAPPVAPDFASHQIRSLTEGIDVELAGRIYLCRDRRQTFLHVLRAQSVTVLGLRRRWFFSATERLARALRRGGHQVILAKSA